MACRHGAGERGGDIHTVLEGKETTVQILHQEGPGREGWGNPKPTNC